MSTLQFYQERAQQSRKEAQDATLDNVRDRCLSAAQAWDAMADRVKRTQVYRDGHAAARAGAETSPPDTTQENDHYEPNEPGETLRPAPANPPAAH